ncbi:MAG: Ppx/GppA phosphatase [Ignavibacteria bacterium]|nr:Ppx/GppA phosphatase [Ignavibacteria bacterium]
MKNMKAAGIDIGTNTILMVIGRKLGDGSYEIIRDEHKIARLGEGSHKTGSINEEAAGRAKTILKNYRRILDDEGVIKIRAAGTAALRDAGNGPEILARLSDTIGCQIEIISGEQEAEFSFRGATEGNTGERETKITQAIVIDIGGGSTEIIQGTDRKILYRVSLPIGSVRLTEKFFTNHPPAKTYEEQARTEIRNFLLKEKQFQTGCPVYAVAGTATTFASAALRQTTFNYAEVDGYLLRKEMLDEIINRFLVISVEQIINDYGIHPKRADVITMGGIILSEILSLLKTGQCIVSCKGLRYGLLYSID